jgi:hypothetical protein
MVVTQAQIKTRHILERGAMTEPEREWLIRIAQLMMFSIF